MSLIFQYFAGTLLYFSTIYCTKKKNKIFGYYFLLKMEERLYGPEISLYVQKIIEVGNLLKSIGLEVKLTFKKLFFLWERL